MIYKKKKKYVCTCLPNKYEQQYGFDLSFTKSNIGLSRQKAYGVSIYLANGGFLYFLIDHTKCIYVICQYEVMEKSRIEVKPDQDGCW